jgi:hypothetical protein
MTTLAGLSHSSFIIKPRKICFRSLKMREKLSYFPSIFITEFYYSLHCRRQQYHLARERSEMEMNFMAFIKFLGICGIFMCLTLPYHHSGLEEFF